jgi:hypothetical protein
VLAKRGAVLAAVLLSLAAGGCGGSKSSSKNNASSDTTSPASTSSSTSTASTTTTSTSLLPGQVAGAGPVSSVVFTGDSANPTVTINGSGLGQQPPPNPSYTPEGQKLCPLPPSGNQGYDYGVSLYLADPSRNWSGGRYRPELGELDCIGLLPSTFTATKVVFTFGSAYAQYQKQDNYLLAEGDPYQLVVNGAAFQGTVHYTQG